MGGVGELAVRGLAGGVLVVLFSLVGEVVDPKAFAGLFSSAPSVAVASLAITLLAEGARTGRHDCAGMIVGGVGMAACCASAAASVSRVGARWGSLVAWVTWGPVALGLYWAVYVGAR
jgi:hypothetical protein